MIRASSEQLVALSSGYVFEFLNDFVYQPFSLVHRYLGFPPGEPDHSTFYIFMNSMLYIFKIISLTSLLCAILITYINYNSILFLGFSIIAPVFLLTIFSFFGVIFSKHKSHHGVKFSLKAFIHTLRKKWYLVLALTISVIVCIFTFFTSLDQFMDLRETVVGGKFYQENGQYWHKPLEKKPILISKDQFRHNTELQVRMFCGPLLFFSMFSVMVIWIVRPIQKEYKNLNSEHLAEAFACADT